MDFPTHTKATRMPSIKEIVKFLLTIYLSIFYNLFSAASADLAGKSRGRSYRERQKLP